MASIANVILTKNLGFTFFQIKHSPMPTKHIY